LTARLVAHLLAGGVFGGKKSPGKVTGAELVHANRSVPRSMMEHGWCADRVYHELKLATRKKLYLRNHGVRKPCSVWRFPLNFSDANSLIVQPDLMAMDERRTLSILGWTIGGVVASRRISQVRSFFLRTPRMTQISGYFSRAGQFSADVCAPSPPSSITQFDSCK